MAIKKLLYILLLAIPIHAQEFEQSKGTIFFEPIYCFQYGYLNRKNDFELFMPYIGLNLVNTQHGTISALVGLALFYKKFTWKLEYFQGLLPPPQFLDYNYIEYYGQHTMSYEFDFIRLTSLTQFGNVIRLFSDNVAGHDAYPDINFSIIQTFIVNSIIYHDDFVIASFVTESGVDYVSNVDEGSIFFEVTTPTIFDFIHSKLAVMSTLFYALHLYDRQTYVIGRKFSGYIGAVEANIVDANGLFNNYYQMTGTIDAIYRIYASALPTLFSRLYLALGGNVGFGYHIHNDTTDLLYTGTIAVGYQYNDRTPFEFRFSMDQDGNFFVNLSLISPLAIDF